jgi:hypothetical protein
MFNMLSLVSSHFCITPYIRLTALLFPSFLHLGVFVQPTATSLNVYADLHATPRLPLYGYSWNIVHETFINLCQCIPSFLKIGLRIYTLCEWKVCMLLWVWSLLWGQGSLSETNWGLRNKWRSKHLVYYGENTQNTTARSLGDKCKISAFTRKFQ